MTFFILSMKANIASITWVNSVYKFKYKIIAFLSLYFWWRMISHSTISVLNKGGQSFIIVIKMNSLPSVCHRHQKYSCYRHRGLQEKREDHKLMHDLYALLSLPAYCSKWNTSSSKTFIGMMCSNEKKRVRNGYIMIFSDNVISYMNSANVFTGQ